MSLTRREQTGLKPLTIDQKDPTGFLNRTDSTISFSDSAPDRTFSIQPAVTSFDFYILGEKITKSGTETIQITAVQGLHFIYYDNTGTLQTDANPSSTQIEAIIKDNAFVAVIYWETVTPQRIYFGDERHGLQMDGATHAYLHTTRGTQFLSGSALTNFVVDGAGDVDTHAQFGSDAGAIQDEDLVISNAAVLSTTGMPFYWKLTASGDWFNDGVAGFSVANVGSGRLAWNEFTLGAWVISEVPNNQFVLYHIFETNNIDFGYISVMGEATYNNIVSARDAAANEIDNLIKDGMPFAEFVPIGSVIFQTSDSYTNAVKARVRSTATGDDYVDFRFSGISPSSTSPTSHPNLTDKDYDASGHGSGFTGFQRGTTISASDPTVNDDETLGYLAGNDWYNSTSSALFTCTDPTTGAAIWSSTTLEWGNTRTNGTGVGLTHTIGASAASGVQSTLTTLDDTQSNSLTVNRTDLGTSAFTHVGYRADATGAGQIGFYAPLANVASTGFLSTAGGAGTMYSATPNSTSSGTKGYSYTSTTNNHNGTAFYMDVALNGNTRAVPFYANVDSQNATLARTTSLFTLFGTRDKVGGGTLTDDFKLAHIKRDDRNSGGTFNATGSVLTIENDNNGLTTNTVIPLEIIQEPGATALPISIAQSNIISTNFRKFVGESNTGVTIWMSDGTSPDTNLSGTAGDACFNGDSSKIYYCTGTTNWVSALDVGALPQGQFYVTGKAGSDSNTGKSDELPFLTIAKMYTDIAGETPTITNQFMAKLIGGGVYTEDTTVPSYAHLNGEAAKITGGNTLSDNSSITINQSESADPEAFTKSSGSGKAQVIVKQLLNLPTYDGIKCTSGTIDAYLHSVTQASGSLLPPGITGNINIDVSGEIVSTVLDVVEHNSTGRLNMRFNKADVTGAAPLIDFTGGSGHNTLVANHLKSAAQVFEIPTAGKILSAVVGEVEEVTASDDTQLNLITALYRRTGDTYDDFTKISNALEGVLIEAVGETKKVIIKVGPQIVLDSTELQTTLNLGTESKILNNQQFFVNLGTTPVATFTFERATTYIVTVTATNNNTNTFWITADFNTNVPELVFSDFNENNGTVTQSPSGTFNVAINGFATASYNLVITPSDGTSTFAASSSTTGTTRLAMIRLSNNQ